MSNLRLSSEDRLASPSRSGRPNPTKYESQVCPLSGPQCFSTSRSTARVRVSSLVGVERLTRMLRIRRPAPPLSVGLGRSVLDGPPDRLASPSRSFEFESLQYYDHEKRWVTPILFVVGVERLELSASASRTQRATSCAIPRRLIYYNTDGSNFKAEFGSRLLFLTSEQPMFITTEVIATIAELRHAQFAALFRVEMHQHHPVYTDPGHEVQVM